MFSLFNFSSILGGQLTPFAPMCGRPWVWTQGPAVPLETDASAVSSVA